MKQNKLAIIITIAIVFIIIAGLGYSVVWGIKTYQTYQEKQKQDEARQQYLLQQAQKTSVIEQFLFLAFPNQIYEFNKLSPEQKEAMRIQIQSALDAQKK